MSVPLADPEIGLGAQENVAQHGFALQCRVTTEDPTNRFIPDYGRLSHYRSASGLGIRLDAGSAFTGAVITPFYDSLLAKIIVRGASREEAIDRMRRALRETVLEGVKTSIPFHLRLLDDPAFQEGHVSKVEMVRRRG